MKIRLSFNRIAVDRLLTNIIKWLSIAFFLYWGIYMPLFTLFN